MKKPHRLITLGPVTVRDATDAEKTGPALTRAANPVGRTEPLPKPYDAVEGTMIDEPAPFAPVEEWDDYIARLRKVDAPGHLIRTAEAWRADLAEIAPGLG